MLRHVCCARVAVVSRLYRLPSTGVMLCSRRTHTTTPSSSSSSSSQQQTQEGKQFDDAAVNEEIHSQQQQLKEQHEDAATAAPLSSSSSSADASASPEDDIKSANTDTIKDVVSPEVEPVRWVQKPYVDPSTEPIIDEKGEYIVSRVQWPTGEIAYSTPPPPDGKLAPRFGYNVVQVKKDVSWWKHYQKYPRISVAYINIQVLFLLGAAWLVAFLSEEYRRTTDELKTPGAMVGEHRGRGPVGRQTQKVAFTSDEMSALVNKAQNNWLDAKGEANYIGSKDYSMKKIPRPKEFSVDDFRKR
ncbi:hypothetical protein DQ04_00301110 [Trypanosoma grayi]|uniref:hypothetical protein n=1 Tax=Trypanosoma grayi TaxID=71804 RepID=UPI0004F3F7A1|nr:hypothetical protein DQ04_00301110 [Trypanosoma grayi]KEG14801.1 hypothetical protein DQ04_00301110 [Trypanosoma grayi]